MAPKLIHHPPTISDKIVETLYSNRVTEQNNPHPSPIPSIQNWGVQLFFSVGSSNIGRTLHGGDGGRKAIFFSF